LTGAHWFGEEAERVVFSPLLAVTIVSESPYAVRRKASYRSSWSLFWQSDIVRLKANLRFTALNGVVCYEEGDVVC